MTLTLERPPEMAAARPASGGGPARRAVVRWAWRLFRREWKQQLLVLALVAVAVAAAFLGGTVAVNTPTPANAGFGSAQALATYSGNDPHLAGEIAAIRHKFGTVDVIDNRTIQVPGSINTFSLRAQDPHGAFGGPMLSLVSGRLPSTRGEVALTQDVANDYTVGVGGTWHAAGRAWHVVGIVQDPQNTLDEFALVLPGEVVGPSQVTVLFDTHGIDVSNMSNVETPGSVNAGKFNPAFFTYVVSALGLLLIALVSVGAFMVIAQRRLRAIGMLAATGAAPRHIRLVIRANGFVVGVAGTLIGAVLGFALWLVYRPAVEAGSHHIIGALDVPWSVILPAMVLAVVATYLAASRPAKAISRVPIVTALSGRPAPPRQVHRSAIPGVAFLVLAFVLVTLAGAHRYGGGGALPEVVLGFVALVVAIILLAPLLLSLVASRVSWAPVSMRMALRDLGRYRARSGSALSAISLAVVTAVTVCLVANARYSNVLDYVGSNLASNQVVVWANTPPFPPGASCISPKGNGCGPAGPPLPQQKAKAYSIASQLGATDVVELDQASVQLNHAAPGRNWDGQIYVATPQLLAAFGIKQSQVDPNADILTMRPGLSGTSLMQLFYGNGGPGGPGGPGPNGPGGAHTWPCPPNDCIANPVIQEMPALPGGTSGPNTVLTEHAIQTLHLANTVSVQGWFIQLPQPITATQITNSRAAAASIGLQIETKSDAPTSAEVLNWATVAGTLLALAILAMTIGLIRSEAAADLRTLTATGASRRTRRSLTATTAGGLALLGAIVGTIAGYIVAVAFFRGAGDGEGLSALTAVPWMNLAIILLAMPAAAALGGWLFAGRQPAVISHQAIE